MEGWQRLAVGVHARDCDSRGVQCRVIASWSELVRRALTNVWILSCPGRHWSHCRVCIQDLRIPGDSVVRKSLHVSEQKCATVVVMKWEWVVWWSSKWVSYETPSSVWCVVCVISGEAAGGITVANEGYRIQTLLHYYCILQWKGFSRETILSSLHDTHIQKFHTCRNYCEASAHQEWIVWMCSAQNQHKKRLSCRGGQINGMVGVELKRLCDYSDSGPSNKRRWLSTAWISSGTCCSAVHWTTTR